MRATMRACGFGYIMTVFGYRFFGFIGCNITLYFFQFLVYQFFRMINSIIYFQESNLGLLRGSMLNEFMRLGPENDPPRTSPRINSGKLAYCLESHAKHFYKVISDLKIDVNVCLTLLCLH